MKRNIRIYLQDMHDNMLKAQEYTEGLDYESFAADSKTNEAVVRCLEIIGEAAKNVPDQVRSAYPEIPWRQMTDRRTRKSMAPVSSVMQPKNHRHSYFNGEGRAGKRG